MKSLGLFILLLFSTAAGAMADEPLIPAVLNGVLPRVHSGMSGAEVKTVLAAVYPKVEAHLGEWSGQTGYIDFRIDDRYRISISTQDPPSGGPDEKTAIVNQELLIYLFDAARKERWAIERYQWDVQSAAAKLDAQSREKFDRLYQQWQQECKKIANSSKTGDYVGLPAVRSMVAMGRAALPYLQEKMEQGQGMDFMLAFAVVEINGWNKADFRGGSEQDFRDKVLARMKTISDDRSKAAAHTEWIACALKEMQTIKPGMTRAELLKVVSEEGGLSNAAQRRYAYRECPYIKVDVKFDAARDPDGRVGRESPEDKITSISQPFLEWMIGD